MRVLHFSLSSENMQHGSGSIIQVQFQKALWYPFQTIVQCVSKLTELDVFYHTHNHEMKFGLHPLCPPEYRQDYSMETALLKVQNDMLLIMHAESPCSFSSTDKILLE